MKYAVFSQKQKRKLTKTVVAAHGAILLGGCAMTTPIHYTDGKPAQFVECSASRTTHLPERRRMMQAGRITWMG